MKKTKQVIALDLDGVIWDLINPWIDYYNESYNDNVKYKDVKDYDLAKSFTKASMDQILDILLVENFWESVEPFKHSKYLKKLNDEFDLYIATKTDYRLLERKVNRLLILFPFLNPDQIICIHDKSLLRVDWLVDDCVDNLDNGKFKKIVLDAPYNKECKYIRAKNLKEVYNIISTGEK